MDFYLRYEEAKLVDKHPVLVGNNTPWAASSDQTISYIDINGDGFNEVLISGRQTALSAPQNFDFWSNSPVLIFEQSAKGWSNQTEKFIPNAASRSLMGTEPQPLVADFDRDGDLDFVVAGGTDMPLWAPNYFYKNNSGVFERIEIGERAWSHGSTIADINQDGFMDVIFSGYGNNEEQKPGLQIGLGGQNGFTFYSPLDEWGNLRIGGSGVAAGDFINPGDGKLEIVLTDSAFRYQGSENDSSMYSWELTSDNKIKLTQLLSLPKPYFITNPEQYYDGSHDIRAYQQDFDSDGFVDIILTSMPGQRIPGSPESNDRYSAFQFIKNNGDGSFVDVSSEFLVGYNHATSPDYSPKFHDFNGDEITDILLSSNGPLANSTAILLGQSDGSYQEMGRPYFQSIYKEAFELFDNAYPLEGGFDQTQIGHGDGEWVPVGNGIYDFFGMFFYDKNNPETDSTNKQRLLWSSRLSIESFADYSSSANAPTVIKVKDARGLIGGVAGPDDSDFVVIDVPLGFKLSNINLVSASSLGGQLNINLSDFKSGAALGAASRAFQNDETGLTTTVEMLSRSLTSGEYLLEVRALATNVTYSIQAIVEADDAARAFLFSTFSNGVPVFVAGEKFAGSASLNLDYQIIDPSDNAVIVGSTLNDFIVLQGTGNKAADGAKGADVIDGGTGSTFITGGGAGDSDTFFLDGRAAGTSWSTITDFELGLDKATIWGWKAGVSKVNTAFTDFNTGGAAGYTGLTLHFENLLPDGSSTTDTNTNLNSITLTGMTLQDFGASSLAELSAQLTNGTNSHFVVSSVMDAYGDHGYLYIS